MRELFDSQFWTNSWKGLIFLCFNLNLATATSICSTQLSDLMCANLKDQRSKKGTIHTMSYELNLKNYSKTD